ncbi:MAG: hypothetical protein KF878_33065 [Planctomycetes bacterium]|nr:hypothetical protein [Planctomycetota bacterium]
MSDARRRDHERRAAGTGALEDEAARLQALARAGELRPGALEIAAYCGHEAARLIAVAPAPTSLEYWVRGLERWGTTPLVVAALAAAALVAPAWRESPLDADPVERALEAARAWVACPCRAHEDAAFAAGHAADRVADGAGPAAARTRAAIQVASYAAWSARAPQPPTNDDDEPTPVTDGDGPAQAAAFAREVLGSDERLWPAVRRAVLAWALDPVDRTTTSPGG